MKKYKILENETKQVLGHTLHRIQAVRDFGKVKAGDIGGWIERESNLSHDGNCWVYEEAVVCGDAQVLDNAKIYNNAGIYGRAIISDDAQVYHKAFIDDEAMIYGFARIYQRAKVYHRAEVYDKAQICGDAEVYDNAHVCGQVFVYDQAQIRENAMVSHSVKIYGNANIAGNAKVKSKNDYLVFKNNWSSGRYFTWTRSNDKWSVGCFYGTGEQLIEKAYHDSDLSGKMYEATVNHVKTLMSILETKG